MKIDPKSGTTIVLYIGSRSAISHWTPSPPLPPPHKVLIYKTFLTNSFNLP